MRKFKVGDKVYSQTDPFHVLVHLGVEEVVGISKIGSWVMYHTLREGQDPQEARYGSRAERLVLASKVDAEIAAREARRAEYLARQA